MWLQVVFDLEFNCVTKDSVSFFPPPLFFFSFSPSPLPYPCFFCYGAPSLTFLVVLRCVPTANRATCFHIHILPKREEYLILVFPARVLRSILIGLAQGTCSSLDQSRGAGGWPVLTGFPQVWSEGRGRLPQSLSRNRK